MIQVLDMPAFNWTGMTSRGAVSLPICRVTRPQPQLGAKCVALTQKGVYIMEQGPGSLVTIACTHAGSGIVVAYDGYPDENGFVETYSPDPKALDQDLTKPGLELVHCHPAIMGSWMMNSGYHHGLTIILGSEDNSPSAIASIVWMPFIKRTK